MNDKLYFNRVHNYKQDCSVPYGPYGPYTLFMLEIYRVAVKPIYSSNNYDTLKTET